MVRAIVHGLDVHVEPPGSRPRRHAPVHRPDAPDAFLRRVARESPDGFRPVREAEHLRRPLDRVPRARARESELLHHRRAPKPRRPRRHVPQEVLHALVAVVRRAVHVHGPIVVFRVFVPVVVVFPVFVVFVSLVFDPPRGLDRLEGHALDVSLPPSGARAYARHRRVVAVLRARRTTMIFRSPGPLDGVRAVDDEVVGVERFDRRRHLARPRARRRVPAAPLREPIEIALRGLREDVRV